MTCSGVLPKIVAHLNPIRMNNNTPDDIFQDVPNLHAREQLLRDNSFKTAKQYARRKYTKEDIDALNAEYVELTRKINERKAELAQKSAEIKAQIAGFGKQAAEKYLHSITGYHESEEEVYFFQSQDRHLHVDVYDRNGRFLETRPATFEERQLNLFSTPKHPRLAANDDNS